MNLLSITLAADNGIRIEAAWGVLIFLLVVLVAVIFYRRSAIYGPDSYLEVNEAELGIGTGKVKLKANIEDLQIGFKLWTELATRKIGLPFDEEYDVVVEVYDSWYEFFGLARELIKSVPVSKARNNIATKELILVSLHILNGELRPHLTCWQAKFRSWWKSATEDSVNKGKAPQQLQREYEQYDELIAEMKAVNQKLVAYTRVLRGMIGI